jgi:hypothetical protein
MATTTYRRTPLPSHAKTPVGSLALCIVALVFSPFAGFAIHGQVAVPGLVIGLWLAVVPLCGLAGLAVWRWHAWRTLPPQLVEEWTSGRLIPAAGAPACHPPLQFSNGERRIDLLADGAVFSRSALLSTHDVATSWVADAAGQLFIPWADIVEWGVDTDSDGPDFHLLRMRPAGQVRIRRFVPGQASECALLDAVRSVGQVPVRLRCDVAAPA